MRQLERRPTIGISPLSGCAMKPLHSRRDLIRGIGAIGAALALCVPRPIRVSEESGHWPQRPLRIIVPFGAGGTSDLLARLVAERLATHLGSPVVIENRPGGAGVIGTAALARERADGHVFGLATVSTFAALPALDPRLPYDPLNDFAPVAMLARVPSVLSVHRSVHANDVRQLIELARARPGELTSGTPGVGSLGHLRMLQLGARLGIELLHVPYRSLTTLLNDALAGRLHLFGDNLLSALVFLNGPLQPVAVSGPHRVPALPRVPTFGESGLDDAGEAAWFGLVAPATTPVAIIERLNAHLHDVMNETDLPRLLAPSGSKAVIGSPLRMRDELIATLADLRGVVARHGLAII